MVLLLVLRMSLKHYYALQKVMASLLTPPFAV